MKPPPIELLGFDQLVNAYTLSIVPLRNIKKGSMKSPGGCSFIRLQTSISVVLGEHALLLKFLLSRAFAKDVR